MDETKRLNVDACNLEETRGALKQANENFQELYGHFERLRADFDSFIAQLGHLGARPT